MKGINGLSLQWSEMWGKRGSLRSTPILRGTFLLSQGLWVVAVFADRCSARWQKREGTRGDNGQEGRFPVQLAFPQPWEKLKTRSLADDLYCTVVLATVQLESLRSLASCLQAADAALSIDLGSHLGTVIGGDNRSPAGHGPAFCSSPRGPSSLPSAGGLLPRPTLPGSILHQEVGEGPVRLLLRWHRPYRKMGGGDAELRKA